MSRLDGRAWKALALAVTAVATTVPADAAVAGRQAGEPARVFAAGGTRSAFGAFFPGTAVDDGSTLRGAPYVIEQGQDLLLTNLDHSTVSNCHQVQSLDSRRNKKPLFSSKTLCNPAEESLMRTSFLKPGVYGYVCAVHGSMLGLIEVR